MPSCFIKTCSNSDKKNPRDVSFHQIPMKMKEKWIEALGLSSTAPVHHRSVICSEHFKNSDFLNYKLSRRLKDDAIPSVNIRGKKMDKTHFVIPSTSGFVREPKSSITLKRKRDSTNSSARQESPTKSDASSHPSYVPHLKMGYGTDSNPASKQRTQNAVFIMKKCLVPVCMNNSILNGDKLFVMVPWNFEIRKRWYEAIFEDEVPIKKTKNLYVCEDHFNLQEDAENFLRFKMKMGKLLRMKKDAVPTKNLKKIGEMPTSQLSSAAKKRKQENIVSNEGREELFFDDSIRPKIEEIFLTEPSPSWSFIMESDVEKEINKPEQEPVFDDIKSEIKLELEDVREDQLNLDYSEYVSEYSDDKQLISKIEIKEEILY